MKTLKKSLILTGLLFCLYACKKDGNANPDPVVGKWNIVSISNPAVNYTGKPGDYFAFAADGAGYTKEGRALGTFNYTISGGIITLTLPQYPDALAEWGRIKTITAHSLVIDGLYPVSPGGPITEGSSINLSR